MPSRITVLDNDGTPWCEIPTETVVRLDRVKALAPRRPDRVMRQPFFAAPEGDRAGDRALDPVPANGWAVIPTHDGWSWAFPDD